MSEKDKNLIRKERERANLNMNFILCLHEEFQRLNEKCCKNKNWSIHTYVWRRLCYQLEYFHLFPNDLDTPRKNR